MPMLNSTYQSDQDQANIQRAANIINALKSFGEYRQKNKEQSYMKPYYEAETSNRQAEAMMNQMKAQQAQQFLLKKYGQQGGVQPPMQQPQFGGISGQPSLTMPSPSGGAPKFLSPQQLMAQNQMGGGFQGGQVVPQQATQQQDPLAALEAEIESETDFEGNLTTRGKLLKAKYNAEQMSTVMQDRFEKNRKYMIDNPILAEDTKKSLGAVNYMSPLIENVNANIDKLVESGELDENSWKRFANDIIFDSEFGQYYVKDGSSFKDSPYEEVFNDIENMKITGFSIAGAAFTETERKIIEQGFSPKGKSLKRWKKDIAATRNYMLARAKAGTIGTTEARKQIAELEEQIGSGGSAYDYESAFGAILNSDEE